MLKRTLGSLFDGSGGDETLTEGEDAMRHGGQRSRRFMRRAMERDKKKRLIAMGREAERRNQNGKPEGLADKTHA